jgi:hypothetical protein
VPRFEDLNARHHALREERRRREMGHSLERAHDLPSFGELGAALSASLDVRNQRRYAESGLAVEKLIDFVW